MFFFALLLLTSFLLPVLAAPIPLRRLTKRDSGGWPESGTDFGVSGGFQESWIIDKKGDDGKVLQAYYPEGSYAGAAKPNPGMGGWTFQASGGPDVNLKDALAVEFKYSVLFEEGFEFQEGGKLPGPYGKCDGAPDNAGSGGHKDDRAFSARVMWRKDGKGEIYAYLPEANKDHPMCKSGGCDLKYGISLGTGKFTFTAGEWATITVYMKLNSKPDTKDGVIELSFNGNSVIRIEGLIIRVDDSGRILGAMIHTFFGGSTSDIWKSPKGQKAWFKAFGFRIVENLKASAKL